MEIEKAKQVMSLADKYEKAKERGKMLSKLESITFVSGGDTLILRSHSEGFDQIKAEAIRLINAEIDNIKSEIRSL